MGLGPQSHPDHGQRPHSHHSLQVCVGCWSFIHPCFYRFINFVLNFFPLSSFSVLYFPFFFFCALACFFFFLNVLHYVLNVACPPYSRDMVNVSMLCSIFTLCSELGLVVITVGSASSWLQLSLWSSPPTSVCPSPPPTAR